MEIEVIKQSASSASLVPQGPSERMDAKCSVIRSWLPPPEVHNALTEEPRRFRAIFRALKADLGASQGLERNHRSLEWLSLVQRLEVERFKSSVDSADVNDAVEIMLDIVLHSSDSLPARTRWAHVLTSFLLAYRYKITVTIPWRPIYTLLAELLHRPNQAGYEGPLSTNQESDQLVALARRARRFFPPGSAQEIWDELRPMLADTHNPDAFEAVAWLALLMPTREVRLLAGVDWNGWMECWMAAWETVVHSPIWDALWLTLLSRLAKHDNMGAIDWRPYISRILTKSSWCFQVPVGTASSQPPFGRRAPETVSAMFNHIVTKRCVKVAKLLIWLLERVKQPAEGLGEEDEVLLGLERLGNLLEQYYHPSNFGKWTGTMGHFVERLTRTFSLRVYREQSPGFIEGPSSDEEDDLPEPPPQTNGHRPAAEPLPPLSGGTQDRVARLIVRLASKSQYAKDRDLVSKACYALARMSHWVPNLVLPLIYERFQVALEAVTAAHQLSIAVHTLGICVRPLLLAGLAPGPESAGRSDGMEVEIPPRVAASEAIAGAMMATLPGIDANDDRKTRAVFRFYCVVLCSVGSLPEGESALPLYTEEWLDGLLSRLFTLLDNLDSPETRNDQSTSGQNKADYECQSFLLNEDCMFRPMLELLMARLPPALRTHAIKKIARFMITSTLPSVATETAVLCSIAGTCAPQETAKYLAEPLLAALEAELPSLKKAGSAPGAINISKVQETSLKWQLTVLSNTCSHLGASVVPFKSRLLHLLDTLFALPSHRLAEATGSVLSSVLHGCTQYYQRDCGAPTPFLPGTEVEGLATEAWLHLGQGKVPDSVLDGLKPDWHIATQEEIGLAEELLKRHLLGAARELVALCQGAAAESPRPTEKQTVRVLILRMQQCLSGVRCGLPDLRHAGPNLPGDDLSVTASAAATVGTAEMREEAAHALLVACRHNFSDPEVQQQLMEAVDEILSRGYEDHAEYHNQVTTWKADSVMLGEDVTASLLTHAEGKWRARRPRFLQVQRAQMLLVHRSAVACYRSQMTSLYPSPPLSWLPAVFKDLCVELLRYSLQTYVAVSSAADHGLRRAAKRYPCLITPLLPTLLSALGGLEAPALEDVRKSLEGDAGTDLSNGSTRELPAPRPRPSVEVGLMERLCRAAATSAVQSTPTTEATAAELSSEEGRVIGAVNLLSSPAIWRACTRNAQPLLALAAALLGSSAHRSPRTAASVANLFALYLLRFLRPAELDTPKAMVSSQHLRLLVDLLTSIGGSQAPKVMQWKFSLMANGMLLMLAPARSPDTAKVLAAHFFPHLLNQLTPQRNMAGVFFIYTLNSDHEWLTEEVKEATREGIREGLAANPQWASQMMELYAHSHPTVPPSTEPKAMGIGGSTRDDILVRMVGSSMLKHLAWPVGRPSPTPIKEGAFNLAVTQTVMLMTDAAPAAMVSALRPCLEKALKGVPLLEDRPATLVAIECFMALICSGHLFAASGSQGSEWDRWARGLLEAALESAPLDFGLVWGVALRYGLHCLAERSPAGFQALLDLICKPVSVEDGTASLTKWLKVVGNVLAELSALGVLGCKPYPKDDPIKCAGQGFQLQILGKLPHLTHSSGESVRSHAASCAVVLLSSLLYTGVTPGAEATPDNKLSRDAQSYLDHLVQAMEEGAAAVAAAEKQSNSKEVGEAGTTEATGQQHNGSILQDPAIARLGTALQVINQSLRGGEGLGHVPMRLTLLKMLPALLRIQEMAAPELQPLALEAKSDAASLKYLPLPAHLVGGVVDTLADAARAELWPARAAALAFLQYFWFRHIFVMAPQQAAQCQQTVVSLMRDRKLEVQEMATNTLSGMLKGLPEAAFDALRRELLQQAETLFPRRQRRRTEAGSQENGTAVEKHAVVLGLKAFIMNTPYDVPPWLPEVLMALTQASSQPAPIKSTVRKTLSEFKRTHEQAGLAEVRHLLTEDQWETIQGIASPASYFA